MDAPRTKEEKMDLWTQRITRWVTRFAHWVSVHWLLMLNLAMGLWAGLPILAPILAHAGYGRGAQLLYWLFRPLCHQIPERSFFLFGRQWTYSYEQLSQLLGGGDVSQRWIGQGVIGYKTAICQRDVAIYASLLLAGLIFSLVRGRAKPLRPKILGLMILPMAIDGMGQLVGLWSSTWESRVATGALFGVACAWFAFPYLERGMREVRQETEKALKDQAPAEQRARGGN